jgi:cytochrome P450
MTDDQIKSHIGIMFTAGSSTTHDSLGNLIYALLSTDNDWQRVKMDTSLRQKAIEETLRWEPAVSILPRMSAAGRTTTLGGVEMVADSFVLFAISAANHDASIFENPHEFDLDRNTEAIMTFGPGPRMCPGMHLA